jgi:hypothetical protein
MLLFSVEPGQMTIFKIVALLAISYILFAVPNCTGPCTCRGYGLPFPTYEGLCGCVSQVSEGGHWQINYGFVFLNTVLVVFTALCFFRPTLIRAVVTRPRTTESTVSSEGAPSDVQ